MVAARADCRQLSSSLVRLIDIAFSKNAMQQKCATKRHAGYLAKVTPNISSVRRPDPTRNMESDCRYSLLSSVNTPELVLHFSL
jgi:hypothetical protein